MPQLPHTPTRLPRPASPNGEDTETLPSTEIFPTPHARTALGPDRPERPPPMRAASTPPEIMSDSRIRPMPRGTPGDLSSVSSLPKSWDRQQLSKKRSQYYTEVFATREPNNTPKDRISRDSVIIADLKLSGALDETTSLVSDFSFHLAQIYQRPESCILLTIQDSTLLVFGGSCEPAYLLSITALASEIAPTKNKRTTALLQTFLHEMLGIAAKRGVVKYTAIAEENLATNGVTTLGEIENLERATSEENSTLRSISRAQHRRGRKNSMTPLIERSRSPPMLTPPVSNKDIEEPKSNNLDVPASERRRVRRGKSFLSFFGVRT